MSQEGFNTLKSYLPWIQSPLIVNAPMGAFAGPKLASEVTLAGGHGQIGSMSKHGKLEEQLKKARHHLKDHDHYKKTGMLPLSVGFLMYIGNLEKLLPLIKEYKPAVVWLFAAVALDDYTTWGAALREASPQTKLWMQTGSVKNALYLAQAAKPDALVIQGHDAGGHGYEVCAGIVSLLPEVIDAFQKTPGLKHVPLLAAGGIADGRGVAAALALGAAGVVMGTRFLGAPEAKVHAQYRDKVISTSDGGQLTVKTKVFDEYNGPNEWPHRFDSRGLVTPTYLEHADAVELAKLKDLYGEGVIMSPEQMGKKYAVLWMGTSVGLVRKMQPAREIVEEVRAGAKKALGIATAYTAL